MDKSRKFLVVVNPAAGRGRAAQARAPVEAYLRSQGVNVDFITTRDAADARRRAGAAAATGYTHVVALGGDGTFHQILNGAFGDEIVLGLLPAGGGNDLARALDLPRDAVAAAHTLLHSPIRTVDVLRVHSANGPNIFYVGAGGLGLDADAARLANGRYRRFPGMLRYIAAALEAFRKFRPFALDLIVDGVPARAEVLLIAVANSPSYGSGVIVAPSAEIDDGWMDLMLLVAPLGWRQIIDGLILAQVSGDIRWPEIRRMRARRISLAAGRAAAFHGDGEILAEAPVEVEVCPLSVRIVAPHAQKAQL
ncbi:MAG: YegS/Rv2252/BmrU family lipid kinase [Acidipila sp.]|nr:YegS/Rv2252/BmrU family lipid kinase [Acidipila sp.]